MLLLVVVLLQLNKGRCKVSEKTVKCKKCGFEWTPLVDAPKVCPSCKSYKWKEERKRK